MRPLQPLPLLRDLVGKQGCTTADLMKILGWEKPEMAMKYTHLDDTRMQQIIGFLETTEPAEEKPLTVN